MTQTCDGRATLSAVSNLFVLAQPPLSSMERPLNIELVILIDGVLVDTGRPHASFGNRVKHVCAAGELARRLRWQIVKCSGVTRNSRASH